MNSTLDQHDAVYRDLVRRVERAAGRDSERTLRWIGACAGFASRFHTGRFADGQIENPALEVGRSLEAASVRLPAPEFARTPDGPRRRRRLLHVATKLPLVGGHSRLLLNWIRNDTRSRHSLVLTQSGSRPVPEPIAREVEASGGFLYRLPSRVPLRRRAAQLRRLSAELTDFVVLHQDPGDVVPVAALAENDLPPVAVMNHADHVFWLGASVADSVFNIRDFALRLSERRRSSRRTDLVPIPLQPDRPSLDRDEARRRLGVGPTDTVVLTMGSGYKFQPSASHDFFTTGREILRRNPGAHLFLVGIPPEAAHRFCAEDHSRFHWVAPLDDPTPYEAAADIVLEPFPFGSLTSVLQTVALGAHPVLMYDPTPQLDISEDPGFAGLVRPAASREEYIEGVTCLIRNPGERRERSAEIQRRMIRAHTGPGWRETLDAALLVLGEGGHRLRSLPETPSERLPEDLDLVRTRAPHLGDRPLYFRAYQAHYAHARAPEAAWLLWRSLRTADTRPTAGHLLPWARLLARTTAKDALRFLGVRL